MLSFTNTSLTNLSLISFFEAILVPSEKWTSLLTGLYTISPVNEVSNSIFFSTTSSFLFSANVIFLLFGLIIFYSAAYGLKTFKFISSSFDINFTLFSYFSDLEEEMGAADDALFFFLIITAVIVWFFLFTLFSAVLLNHISWILSLLVLSTSAAFVIPAAVLKNFGIAFVTYVRGHGRSRSIFYEAILDIVSVSIIFLRFIVQNMRFIFIFFTFFELYEFIYQNLAPVTTLTTNFSNYYWSETVIALVSTYGLYLYYLGHSTIIFIAQLSVYFALSFWLFFFLYTAFTLESSEKYFFNKRALLNA